MAKGDGLARNLTMEGALHDLTPEKCGLPRFSDAKDENLNAEKTTSKP